MPDSDALIESWAHVRQSLGAGTEIAMGKALHVQRAVAAMLACGELPPQVRKLRIACLRAVTVEPVMPLLIASMAAQDFAASVELGQLGNYVAESVMPDSFLHRGNFDVCVVLVPWEAVSAECRSPTARFENVAHLMQNYLDCLERLAESFPGFVIVCNFAGSQSGLAGRFQSQQSHSSRYAIARANQIVAEHLEKRKSVAVSDLDCLVQRVGQCQVFSARNMATLMQPFSPSGFQLLCDDWAHLCRIHFRGSPKCIVVDCDNTLWGGIVGEDGIHGIRLGETYPGVCFQEFQRQLKLLKEMGFLLAINSRNNETDIRDVFLQNTGMVLALKDFAAIRANWRDKASNMASIAEELNLGVDSFVFIDDNAFEIELVRTAFPGITTLAVPRDTWKLPQLLPECGWLDRLRLTAEDRSKAEMYAQEQQRKAAQRNAPSVEEYLSKLGLKMTIERFSAEKHSLRAVQLLQKTNQFNLTSRRYSENGLLDLIESGAMVYLASLQDSYGDYGRVALAIIVVFDGQPRIDTYLMSCRAMGRKAETVFFSWLLQRLAESGFTTVRAEFVPSSRNQVCAGFLSEHGFKPVDGANGGGQVYERKLDGALPSVVDSYEVVCLDPRGM